MDPLIKSQLLYPLSYAPSEVPSPREAHLVWSVRRSKGAPLSTAPVDLSSLPLRQKWLAAAYHRARTSDRRKVTLRLIWALSTKPSPMIMVSIEVPP